MNLPRGNFEAQDNDDYEEIDDDMLDEWSDVEDPDFYIRLVSLFNLFIIFAFMIVLSENLFPNKYHCYF